MNEGDQEEFTIATARSCLTQIVEKKQELRLILDSVDADYSQFWIYVLNGTCLSPNSQLKTWASQLCTDEDLVYLDCNRIVLPNASIKNILDLLHISHTGVNRTYEMARSLYIFGRVC